MQCQELKSAEGKGDLARVGLELSRRIKAQIFVTPTAAQVERLAHQPGLEVGLVGLRVKHCQQRANAAKYKETSQGGR
jgi:hypothetical protein